MTFSDVWRILRQKPKNVVFKPPISNIERELDLKRVELEERKNEAELNKLKLQEAKRIRFKKELEEVTNNINEDTFEGEEDSDEGDDDMPPWLAPFIPIISQKLAGGRPQNSENINHPNINAESQQAIYAPPIVSDEELRGFLRTLSKKELKYAKVIPKSALHSMINQKMPISAQDFERGYQILVTEF
jgi:hypothetical protein